MQRARRSFFRWIAQQDPRRLVFVDEFGTNLSMTRRFARAMRGERAPGSAPYNHDPHVTLTMGLRWSGMVAPFAMRGAMDGIAFATYVRDVLGPTLQRGDIVLADGLGAHRSHVVRDELQALGVKFRLLPPYSPDLTPVEQAGSKVKTLLRGRDPRSETALLDAMKFALDRVTARDAHGWFLNDGYAPGLRYRPKRRSRAQPIGPPL